MATRKLRKKTTRRPAGCPPCNCAKKKTPRKRTAPKVLSAKAKAARANLVGCSKSCAGSGPGHHDCVKVCMHQKRTGSESFLDGVKKPRKRAKKA